MSKGSAPTRCAAYSQPGSDMRGVAAGNDVVRLLSECGDEPLVLTNDGKPVAVLWPTLGADMETVSLMLNPRFRRMMQESRESAAREGTLSHAEVRQQLVEVADETMA